MLEAKEKQIGDHRYTVRMFPATLGHKLLLRIGKILGPALGGGLEGIKASFADDGAQGLGKAIRELFDRASPDEIDSIVKEFAGYSEVDGKPLKSIFDLHFAGKLSEMYKWIAFALEANYSDFFGVFKGASAAVVAAMGSRLKSPSTYSGPSGASSANSERP